jgi:hypothetical protein
MVNVKPPNRHANPWPIEITAWLANDAYHAGFEAEMREALLTDKRISDVAERLGALPYIYETPKPVFIEKAPHDLLAGPTYIGPRMQGLREATPFVDGGLHAFLERLLAVPAAWKNPIVHRGDFVTEEIDELKLASDRYLKVLAKHRDLAEFYLSDSSEALSNSIEAGKLSFASMTRSIENIRKLASDRKHFIARADFPTLPRKTNYQDPKLGLRNFFAIELAKQTMEIFGKPLHKEIGLLATVCLRLDRPMSGQQVRNLVRPKRPRAAKTSAGTGPTPKRG